MIKAFYTLLATIFLVAYSSHALCAEIIVDGFTDQDLGKLTVTHISDKSLMKLRSCPFCNDFNLRVNHFTLDGNFHTTIDFDIVIEFFHRWMLIGASIEELYVHSDSEYYAAYRLHNNNQRVTLTLARGGTYYRFETDGRARRSPSTRTPSP